MRVQVDINKKDLEFLISLIPNWAKDDVPRGFFPSFYGTGSYDGDVKIKERYDSIISELKE